MPTQVAMGVGCHLAGCVCVRQRHHHRVPNLRHRSHDSRGTPSRCTTGSGFGVDHPSELCCGVLFQFLFTWELNSCLSQIILVFSFWFFFFFFFHITISLLVVLLASFVSFGILPQNVLSHFPLLASYTFLHIFVSGGMVGFRAVEASR